MLCFRLFTVPAGARFPFTVPGAVPGPVRAKILKDGEHMQIRAKAGCKKAGESNDNKVVEFDDPFHVFMEDCLESTTGPEPSQQDMNEAMSDCVDIWNEAQDDARADFEPPSRQELLEQATKSILRGD